MDFYTGQILPIAFGYAPRQTAFCAGQTLPVTQNAALFTLLGITYGGDGRTSFGLPNTGGRTLVGASLASPVLPIGAVGGETMHTLTSGEMPAHTHALNATNQGTLTEIPEGALPGTPASGTTIYGGATGAQPLAGMPLANQGANQPHPNLQPSLAINFAIVLTGIFPPRS